MSSEESVCPQYFAQFLIVSLSYPLVSIFAVRFSWSASFDYVIDGLIFLNFTNLLYSSYLGFNRVCYYFGNKGC